jgi:type I restriction enzyme S subunit
LSAKIVKKIKIRFPKKEEQQKIANFLSAIDKRIQTLEKKKNLLEQYKKGVMQKIFKQELRFKDDTSTSLSASDGKAFPEWEEKKLGEVCSKKSSNISANKIEENFGEYIIYGASGVLKKVDFYKEENDYVSIIKDGAGVGRIVYCKGKSSVLGTMEIIKPNSKLNTYFLYCLLENVNFKKYITGSTIPHIYFKDYKKEKCNIPPLEEQTKIANFLSTIDKNIELVTKKIEHTKTYKKGLLQQMFV